MIGYNDIGYLLIMCDVTIIIITDSEEVISVFESKKSKIHSTHSWDFLGVNLPANNIQRDLNLQSDVIVGVIDTGI